MSSCYKCGHALPPGQVECDPGCAAAPSPITDNEIKEAFRRMHENTLRVDWNKVATIADVRAFLQAMFGDRVYFAQGSPESFKRFQK